MNSLWLRKQGESNARNWKENIKSKEYCKEFVVLAENFLSLPVWLLMGKKKSKRKESIKHGAVDYTGFDCTDEIIQKLY